MAHTIIEGRLDVRLISPQALAQYMQYRGFTARSLAQRVGCSHSTIGFLMKGTRRNTSPTTAKAIAKALDCPVESLFVVKVSHVSREVAA